VGADMKPNVRESEQAPRMLVAIGIGVIGALVPSLVGKGLLLGGAAALLATVVTDYRPVNAALDQRVDDEPHWRTLKTYRVAT
jgi:hypothetical protein